MTPTYREILVSQGVAHHWPLEETSGSTSSALSGGVSMAINAAVTRGARGAVGNAMRFSGPSSNQYLSSETTSQANIDTTKDFSYSWIMHTEGKTNNHGIVCKRVAASSVVHFAAYLASAYEQRLTFDLGKYQIRWATNWSPEIGKWYHCAYVYTSASNTAQLYVNGTLQDTRVYDAPITAETSDAPIYIGILGGNSTSIFSGTLDEIALFGDKALTADEVAAQYNAVFPIHWIFDGTKWKSANKRRATPTFAGETAVVDFMTYGTSAQDYTLNPAEFAQNDARTIYSVYTIGNLPQSGGGGIESAVLYGINSLGDAIPNRHLTLRFNSETVTKVEWYPFVRFTGGGGLGANAVNHFQSTGRYCSVWGYGGDGRFFNYLLNGVKSYATVAGLAVPHERIRHAEVNFNVRTGGIRTLIFRGEHTDEQVNAIRAAILSNTPQL